ncbi:MAG: hypothetical protein KIS66_09060 [Fimbriimonadaceae bacterium]|nr:hypothetical protein [Fimbriimonadaceae bacterium]
MVARRFPEVFALCLTLMGLGCQGGEPIAAAPEALVGEPKSELVGTWTLRPPGGATMELRADGSYAIEAEAGTPAGPMKSRVEGRWAVKDRVLAMRRPGPDGAPFTAEYDFELKVGGSELVLSRQGSKVRQTYEKGKPGGSSLR